MLLADLALLLADLALLLAHPYQLLLNLLESLLYLLQLFCNVKSREVRHQSELMPRSTKGIGKRLEIWLSHFVPGEVVEVLRGFVSWTVEGGRASLALGRRVVE